MFANQKIQDSFKFREFLFVKFVRFVVKNSFAFIRVNLCSSVAISLHFRILLGESLTASSVKGKMGKVKASFVECCFLPAWWDWL